MTELRRDGCLSRVGDSLGRRLLRFCNTKEVRT